MSRDKQIEEMARDIALAEKSLMVDMITSSIDDLIDWSIPQNEYIAESLYNAGYRKASDVTRDVIMDVIEILNSEYVKCNKWEAYPILAITQKIADLKQKYESEGA